LFAALATPRGFDRIFALAPRRAGARDSLIGTWWFPARCVPRTSRFASATAGNIYRPVSIISRRECLRWQERKVSMPLIAK